ncbi:methyl-accepting chemotaxis protein [Breoghania sp.]|uniref:methyl-accepting chemotaxis protein n=1 Tax=Breoghania sp. TaxID=2065378 RepID=UPI002AA91693|nr:methyl-accepting chemotaxis protein [Breoghania sp.]
MAEGEGTAGKSAGFRFGFVSRLSTRLPLFVSGLALVSCITVGVLGYLNGRDGLVSSAESELRILAHARSDALTLKLGGARSDLNSLVSSANATIVLNEMNQALVTIEQDRGELDAYYRASDDPAERAELTGDQNKTMYSWRHTGVHGTFLTSWKQAGYGDIYVLNMEGRVVYSVTKSADFLEKVSDPTLAGTGLAKAFEAAKGLDNGEQALVDFSNYTPVGGMPSMFLAQPVYLSDYNSTAMRGVMVIRVGVNLLNSVLASRESLGRTGQSFLVGADGVIRSDKPLSGGSTALSETAQDPIIAGAANGQEGFGMAVNGDGEDVYLSAVPLHFMDAKWSVVAERSAEETLAPVVEMRNSMIYGTLLVLVVVTVLGTLYSYSITRALGHLVAALRKIAGGELDTEIKAAKRRDEIGQIGRAVLQIQENAVLEQERKAAEDAAEQEMRTKQRGEFVASLAADFEASVGEVVQRVYAASNELRQSAESMAQIAGSTGERSESVSKASEAAREEVQTIAGASDDLFKSIQEISSLITRSSAIAHMANERASTTDETVRSLAEAADRIGEVIRLISDIADQTNLLALNATIEAARAGEAGKGFAVVASEVKELAGQTAKATGEIGQQIDAIRSATKDAVEAISEIRTTIGEISESVGSVASAVEEQSAATQGIVDNTQRAADGTASMSRDIEEVRQSSQHTGSAAEQVVGAAGHLTEQASTLDQQVRDFLHQIRAA